MTQEELDQLNRFKKGDSKAFDAIVSNYQDRLIGFFYRLCWDRFQAEDLAQEVFIRMIRAAKTYTPSGRLDTFVFRIARNLWIDQIRRKAIRPSLYSLDKPLGDDGETMAAFVTSNETTPQKELTKREEKQLLRQALKNLPENQRLVFELAVYQELPYREVAQALEIPIGTVKSRMFHALRLLKKLIGVEVNGDKGGRK